MLPPTGEVIPLQASPLSPVVVQAETLVALQLTCEVEPFLTIEGTALRESTAGPEGGGGGGGAAVNSLKPPLETQSGSALSIKPSPSLSIPSPHCPGGGGGGGGASLQVNVSVDQEEESPRLS